MNWLKNKTPISEFRKLVADICEFIETKVDFVQVELDDLEVQRPGLIFILLDYYLDLAKGKFAIKEALAKQRNADSNFTTITPQKILVEAGNSVEGKEDYYKICELIRNKISQITRS